MECPNIDAAGEASSLSTAASAAGHYSTHSGACPSANSLWTDRDLDTGYTESIATLS
jgi:hypothetical protein